MPCRSDAMRYTRTGIVEALDRLLAQILGVDAVRHAGVHRLRYQRVAGPGERIQPGGQVHRVAGDRVLGRGAAREYGRHHFAAGDADVQLERVCERVAQLRGTRVQVERGAHRPLGVVAVGNRCAEHRQHAVAGMVDDAAAVGGDGAIGERVEAVQQRLHVLGIHAGAQRGVAGDIGEQNGGLAALAGRRGRRSLRAGPPTAHHPQRLRARDGRTPGRTWPCRAAGSRSCCRCATADWRIVRRIWRWRGSRDYSVDISSTARSDLRERRIVRAAAWLS